MAAGTNDEMSANPRVHTHKMQWASHMSEEFQGVTQWRRHTLGCHIGVEWMPVHPLGKALGFRAESALN